MDDEVQLPKPPAAARWGKAALLLAFGAAIVLLVTVPLLVLLTKLPRQLNTVAGEQHIVVIQSRLGGDPRFAGVNFRTFSMDGGSILIQGEVASEEDADLLRQMVESSDPPLPIVWELGVAPPAEDEASTTQPATTRPVEPLSAAMERTHGP